MYLLNQNRAPTGGSQLINQGGKLVLVKPPALEGVPWVVLLIAVLLQLWTFVLGRTRYGRHVYAVGGNTEAARRAGIRVDRIRISVFVISSFMAAIGGVLLASNTHSVDANTGGGNTLLLAVGAAVIGGTSLFGGRGRPADAIIGGLVVAVIANGMADLVQGNNRTRSSTSSPVRCCCWPPPSTRCPGVGPVPPGSAEPAGEQRMTVAQRLAVRPEEIRRHNLSLLLRHIHQHGELTRAELTAATGLNRSTIGALVSDLVGLGPGHRVRPVRCAIGPAGRRTWSRRAPDGPYVLAVDVAVERIVTATVGLRRPVHERRLVAIDGAERRPEAVDRPDRRRRRAGWRSAGRAVAGPVGDRRVSIPGTVRAPRRLRRARPEPELARGAVRRRCWPSGCRSARTSQVGNDADLGAVAEHQRGAAVGYDHLVYLNGSVGVGGGIIAEGIQLHGIGGYAGEIGHMTINPDGPPCHCGSTGCIETYIGEHALLRAAGITDRHGPRAVDAVFIDAAAGDPRAREAVRTVATWLGREPGQPGELLQPAGDRRRWLAGRGGPAGAGDWWSPSWTGGPWPRPGPG